MPQQNQFRHQSYSKTEPSATFDAFVAEPPPAPGTAAFADRMQVAGDQYRKAGVAAIILTHGTLVGYDPTGLAHTVGQYHPNLALRMRLWTKMKADSVFKDVTNYTRDFTNTLKKGLHRQGADRIQVKRYNWSGENNHVGRFEAAIGLLDELHGMNIPPGRRVLVWGHSHGGNVLALLTNLLTADPELTGKLFAASDRFRTTDPRRRKIQQLLQERAFSLEDRPVDMVTFGTPIRYGWDSGGYSRLLHIVGHRKVGRRPVYRTRVLRDVLDALQGKDGDYVQQWGITGSNFATPFFWNSWRADRRMAKLLEQDLHWRHWPHRVATGMRVPEEGHALLVDYGVAPSGWFRHFLGHSNYTHMDWMLFHVEQVARHLYGPQNCTGHVHEASNSGVT